MNRKRILIVLCVAFVLLLMLNFLRYTQLATKSTDNVVIKWKKDNWTGDTWISQYTIFDVKEYPQDIGNVYGSFTASQKEIIDQYLYNRQRMTNIWILAMLIDTITISWIFVKKEKI